MYFSVREMPIEQGISLEAADFRQIFMIEFVSELLRKNFVYDIRKGILIIFRKAQIFVAGAKQDIEILIHGFWEVTVQVNIYDLGKTSVQ